MDILYKNECYSIQGAIFEVYRELGCGFLESVYQEALEHELRLRQIPFTPQTEIKIAYKGNPLQQTYRADIICYEKVVVELKAVQTLLLEHKAQLLNYLKATGMKVGLLVNFSSYPKVDIKRLILS